MAAGEYVSVSSQADAEGADLAKEAAELAETPQAEPAELAPRDLSRAWLSQDLAEQVAEGLTAADALGAHARDEFGISETTMAKPLQAALASAASFAAGAALPLMVAAASPPAGTVALVSIASLIGLGLLGAVGAKAGGADPVRGAVRVTFWGAAQCCSPRRSGWQSAGPRSTPAAYISLSSVIGRSRTRLPVALKTALAIGGRRRR